MKGYCKRIKLVMNFIGGWFGVMLTLATKKASPEILNPVKFVMVVSPV